MFSIFFGASTFFTNAESACNCNVHFLYATVSGIKGRLFSRRALCRDSSAMRLIRVTLQANFVSYINTGGGVGGKDCHHRENSEASAQSRPCF